MEGIFFSSSGVFFTTKILIQGFPSHAPTIEAVLKEHTDEWMSIPGVVGTGIGACEGKPCIRIFVVKKTPELLKKIPSNLEGFVVDVEETGEIMAR